MWLTCVFRRVKNLARRHVNDDRKCAGLQIQRLRLTIETIKKTRK